MAISEKKEIHAIYKCFECGREASAELPFPISDIGKCSNCGAENFYVINFTNKKGGKGDGNDNSR